MLFIFMNNIDGEMREIGNMDVADELVEQYVKVFTECPVLIDDLWHGVKTVGFNPLKGQFEVEVTE